MRNIIILLAILLASSQAFGQKVTLSTSGKSDVATQVKLQRLSQTKAGNEQVRLLAKVTAGFDVQRLKAQGITVGTKAGDIVTLRLPLSKLHLLEAEPSILQYSISQRIFPTLDRTRYDTHADSVHAVLQCAVQGGAPAAKRIQNRQMFFSELG